MDGGGDLVEDGSGKVRKAESKSAVSLPCGDGGPGGFCEGRIEFVKCFDDGLADSWIEAGGQDDRAVVVLGTAVELGPEMNSFLGIVGDVSVVEDAGLGTVDVGLVGRSDGCAVAFGETEMEGGFEGAVRHARGRLLVADSGTGIRSGWLLWKAYGVAGGVMGSFAGRGFVGAGDAGRSAESGEGPGAGGSSVADKLLVDLAEFAHDL